MSFKGLLSRATGERNPGGIGEDRPEPRRRTSSMSKPRPPPPHSDMERERDRDRKPLPQAPKSEGSAIDKRPLPRSVPEDPEIQVGTQPIHYIPQKYPWPKSDREIKALLDELVLRDKDIFEAEKRINRKDGANKKLSDALKDVELSIASFSDRDSDNNELRKLKKDDMIENQLRRANEIPRKPKSSRRLRQLEDEIAQRDKKISDLQAQLNSIQAQLVHSSSEARWKPMDESAISQELISIRSNIEDFAHEFALKDIDPPKPGYEELESRLAAELNEFWRSPEHPKDIMKVISEVPRGPIRALTGLLSSAIIFGVVMNPFYFVNESFTVESKPEWHPNTSVARYLTFLWTLSRDVDKARAHAWRSDTMRLLSPPETSEAAKRMHTISAESRNAACLNMARTFLEGPAQLVMKPSPNPTEKLKELEELFRQAAKLSTRMWTQRTTFEPLGLCQLLNTPFTANSHIMRAHEMHKIESAIDTTLDGCKVQVVVHPGLQVRGTAHGEAYDSPRVLCKAVVWLQGKAEGVEPSRKSAAG